MMPLGLGSMLGRLVAVVIFARFCTLDILVAVVCLVFSCIVFSLVLSLVTTNVITVITILCKKCR